METGGVLTAAEAYAGILTNQQTLGLMSLLNLFGYLNPQAGHVTNNTIFDYIIIGGGTSGCVLANRLTKDSKVTVLVIEVGGDFQVENALAGLALYNKRSRLDWNYTAKYDSNYTLGHQSGEYYPTLGKVLGGSSSVDFMLYSQGEDRTYENYFKVTGEPSWRFKNILKLIKKTERINDDTIENSADRIYHGFKGNLGLTKDHSPVNDKYFEALRSVGHKIVNDINGIKKLGFTGATYYIDRIRQNTAFAYLYPVRDRSNLVVLKNTQVTKILFDKKKNAIGVEAVVLKNKLKYVFQISREVILAAGPFNSVKLLQLSGIGPKEVLQKFGIPVIVDSPEVGQNYQNHMAIPLVYATEKTCASFDPSQYDPHDFPAPIFLGHVALNKSQTYADYRTMSTVLPFSPAITVLPYSAFIFRFKFELVDYWVSHSTGREMLITYVQNSTPKSRGWVQIQSSDPLDPPIIKPGYFSEEDLTDMIKYAKDFRRIEESLYFEEVGAKFVDPTETTCGKFPADSDKYWQCYIDTMMAPMSHHIGTAAMGLVVDGRLRVNGVKRLRVVDASVLPTMCAGSITFQTILTGENGAEMIIKDWRRNHKKDLLVPKGPK